MRTPIASHEFYGMSPTSIGRSILLCQPDGKVFGDTFTTETVTFQDFLIHHLKDRLKADPPESVTGIELARWYARRGSLEKALEVVASPKTADEHLLRASIFRRQRKSAEALQELAHARKVGGDEVAAEVAMREAIINIRIGNTEQATTEFEEIVSKFPDSNHAVQAQYFLGFCRYVASETDAAVELWNELTESHADSRWAWKAADSLTSTGFQLGLKPQTEWPSQAAVTAMRGSLFENIEAVEPDKAEADATAYLLKHQLEDGSWISPVDSVGARGYNTTTFSIAVMSICGRSLFSLRDRPEISKSIRKAVDFVVKSTLQDKTDRTGRFFMDYTPWGDGYAILFLSDCVKVKVIKKEEVAAAVGSLVADLKQRQKEGGGWSYYITSNIAQLDRPANQSISFMTAAVTIGLLTAREAGFNVPKPMTDKALYCLDRMRNPNRTFEYFLWHDREGQRGGMSEEGADGRGPLCALALYKGGRGGVEEIKSCLDIFLRHREAYSREKGKSLMHSGRGSQGSHYLTFDYAWAAEAVSQLPKEDRQSYRDSLLKLILASRSKNGSYLDNLINGWHYGTGMALDTMRRLR